VFDHGVLRCELLEEHFIESGELLRSAGGSR
jgi:hypothetical protein